MNINSNKKGIIIELIAQQYLILQGYTISKPIDQTSCEYDMIIEKDSKMLRVQVKSIFWDTSNQRYYCSLITSHRKGNEGKYLTKKYTENSFDLLIAIEIETESIYCIPIQEIVDLRGILLYPKPDFQVYKNCGKFEKYKVK